MNEIKLISWIEIENCKKYFLKQNLSNESIETLTQDILSYVHFPSVGSIRKLCNSIRHRKDLDTQKVNQLAQALNVCGFDYSMVHSLLVKHDLFMNWTTVEKEQPTSLMEKISNHFIEQLTDEIISKSFKPKFESVYKLFICLTHKDVDFEKIRKLLKVLNKGNLLKEIQVEQSVFNDPQSMDVDGEYSQANNFIEILPPKFNNENIFTLAIYAGQYRNETLALELIKCLDWEDHKDLGCFNPLNLSQSFYSEINKIAHEDPLVTACRNLSVNEVARLLYNAKDPNTTDCDGTPAVFCALQPDKDFAEECKAIVALFLSSPNFKKTCLNREGFGLLASAFQHQNESLAHLLLQHGLAMDEVTSDFKFPQDFGCLRDFSMEFKRFFISLLNLRLFEQDLELTNFICEAWLCPNQIYQQNLSNLGASKLLPWLINEEGCLINFPNFAALLLSYVIKCDLLFTPQIFECLERKPYIAEGLRGKKLLNMAIAVGNLPLVKRLIAMGVSFKEPYESELDVQNGAKGDLTPLHHALLMNQGKISEYLIPRGGNIEIAEYLISQGGDIDVLSANGQTPLVCLLEKPDFLKNYSEIISWMIDQGVDLEQKNSSNKTLLSIAIENDQKNWPLILQLVEKNAFLSPNERIVLLQKAIEANQYSLIDKLIEQAEQNLHETSLETLVDSLNFKTLTNLLKIKIPFWVCDKIHRFVEAGLDLYSLSDEEGNSLLAHAILSDINEIIPFLISQGADLNRSNLNGVTPDQLLQEKKTRDFVISRADAIANQPKNMQWLLTRNFNLKNLGHLLGTNFLVEMQTDDGKKLEGNSIRVSQEFVKQLLSYVLEYRSKQFSLQTVEQIKKYISELEFSSEVNFRLDSTASIKEDCQLAIASRQIAGLIINKLSSLNINESLFIPGGWSGLSGHLLMIEWTKLPDGFHVKLHNTGAGTGFHGHFIKNGKSYYNTIKHYFIPSEALNLNFIKEILEPSLLGNTFIDHSDRSYSEMDIYNIFSNYEIENQQGLRENYAKEDMSGVCTMSGLLALLDSRIEKNEAILLKRLMKKIVTKLAFQDYAPYIRRSQTIAKIFSESFQEVAQKFHKSTKGLNLKSPNLLKKLASCEYLSKLVDHAKQVFYPRKSENPSLYNLSVPNSQTLRVKNAFESFEKFSESESLNDELSSFLTYSLPQLDKIKNSKDLIDCFNIYYSNIKEIQEKNRENRENRNDFLFTKHVAHFLKHVSKLLIKEYQSNSYLIEDLNNNPKDCLMILELLVKLIRCENLRLDSITFLFCFASGWILSNLIEKQSDVSPEQKVQFYGLNIDSLFARFLSPESQLICSPYNQEDFFLLYNFLNKFKAKTPERALFNFNLHIENVPPDPFKKIRTPSDVTSSLEPSCSPMSLKRSSGDWLYTRNSIDALPHDFWNDIDKDYCKKAMALDSDIESQIEDWRVHYCYLKKGLAPYFYFLNEIALYTFTERRPKPKHLDVARASISGPDLNKQPLSHHINSAYKRNLIFDEAPPEVFFFF